MLFLEMSVIFFCADKKRPCFLYKKHEICKGVKKVCRYNQYYAVKRAEHRLTEEKRGGKTSKIAIKMTESGGKTLIFGRFLVGVAL